MKMKEDLLPPQRAKRLVGTTGRLYLWRPRVGAEPETRSHRLGLWRPRVGRRFGLFLGVLAMVGATLLTGHAPASAADIRARCNGNTPVILERPPGTEYIKVICNKGIPEFMVEQETPIPTIDPVKSGRSSAMPTDWAGWVTVWLNSHPLKTPYDPVRAVPEPGAYLAKTTNRVMMPVRFFTEAFQGRVIWDASQRVAVLYLQGKKVILQADTAEANVDGTVVKLDQKPIIFQDRLFVPVRFLLESFNGKVAWDQSNRSARVDLVGVNCGSPVYCGEVR